MGVGGALGEQEVEAFIDHFGDDDPSTCLREHSQELEHLLEVVTPNPLLHPPPNHFATTRFLVAVRKCYTVRPTPTGLRG